LFKLVLVAAIPGFAASAAPPAIDREKLNAEATTRLAEYVRLDTSNPLGNERRPLKVTASRASDTSTSTWTTR
jgi:hypothetical protein